MIVTSGYMIILALQYVVKAFFFYVKLKYRLPSNNKYFTVFSFIL